MSSGTGQTSQRENALGVSGAQANVPATNQTNTTQQTQQYYQHQLPQQGGVYPPQPQPFVQGGAYPPQQQPQKFPDRPTTEELEARLKSRYVDFAFCSHQSKAWEIISLNLCTYFGIALIWIVWAMGASVAIYFAIFAAFGTTRNNLDSGRKVAASVIITLLDTVIIYMPLYASWYHGFFTTMRQNGQVTISSFFYGYNCSFYWFYLLPVSIVYWIVSYVAYALFVMPGIYFSIAAVFTFGILVEHPQVGLRSIWLSIKVVNRYLCCWMPLFLLLLLIYLFLGVVCLCIGLLLAIPLTAGMLATCYHRLIGVNGCFDYVTPQPQVYYVQQA